MWYNLVVLLFLQVSECYLRIDFINFINLCTQVLTLLVINKR